MTVFVEGRHPLGHFWGTILDGQPCKSSLLSGLSDVPRVIVYQIYSIPVRPTNSKVLILKPLKSPTHCGAILTVWWLVGPSPTRAQTTVGSADVHLPIQNAAGLQLLVATEHTSPVLRVVLPGRPTSDRSIEILFPEHVTVVKQGQRSSQQLYMFSPGRGGDRPLWRRSAGSLEYERDLRDGVHLLARATLEGDGVRFRYEVTNNSRVAYSMIYAPTDPRLTSIFHDVRLERAFVLTPTALTCWRQRRHAGSRSHLISGSLLAISRRSPGQSRRSGSSVATTGFRTTTNPERSTCPSSPRCPPTRHG